jgi:type I restriction enzyme M protein
MTMAPSAAPAAPAKPAPLIVQQGKLLDFVDGLTQRDETPEEYVRQEIAKSLVREYGYDRKDIAVEFSIKLGSRKTRLDLAVFALAAEHAQEKVSLIVECKAQSVKSSDRKEGVGQLTSYLAACPNAHYGMWTNGIERFCYRRVERDGKVSFEEVADIPVFGEKAEESDRPTVAKLRPAGSDALLFAFRRCHNYIAGNQGLQKPQAFWELLKIIFCKAQDERQSAELEFYTGTGERHGINGPLKVKARIDRLFEAVKADYGSIFRANDAVELEPRVLAFIVSQLQMYALLESDVDVKGRAYEEIVGSNLRGDRGEFFTPRNICRMAVSMLDPGEKDLVLDPACGTGGFLITAMNHVIKRVSDAEKYRGGTPKRIETATRARVQRFAQNLIVGLDLNPELVKASKMNMVLNNDGAGGLYQANSLTSPATWAPELRQRDLMGQVDILFTNPPFGSKIPVDDPAILEAYELGHTWTYRREADAWEITEALQRSQPPEILFIERCVRFLKPGSGRLAIVLPDGILGSPGLGYVRDWILRHCRVLASLDLHPDTFQPDVSVQTSVLVLQRKTEELIAVERGAGRMNDYPVFMALANHIGHDKRGNRTYVRDRHGNEIIEEVAEAPGPYAGEAGSGPELRTQQKVVDDNTQQIAKVFREWFSKQS